MLSCDVWRVLLEVSASALAGASRPRHSRPGLDVLDEADYASVPVFGI